MYFPFHLNPSIVTRQIIIYIQIEFTISQRDIHSLIFSEKITKCAH